MLGGVGVALSLGWTPGEAYSPWALLHRLPVFASLRIPSRTIVLTVLAVGMLAGFGMDRLAPRRGGWRLAAVIALLATATVDMAMVGPLAWSPTQLTFAVVADVPDLLVIDYNHDSSWQVVSGRGTTLDHGGLLGVAVPAGSQDLVIQYRGTRFVVGLVLALAALAAGVWGGLRRGRSKPVT